MILKENLKIAVFLPSLSGGGAERVMLTLVNGFSRLGFNIDLVLGNASGPFFDLIEKNINVINLNKSRVMKCLIPLALYLRKEKPQVLLSAIEHANVAAIISRKISFTKCKTIVTIHTTLSLDNAKDPQLKQVVSKIMLKNLYPIADAIVAVSNGVAFDASKMLDINIEKIKVIYNPVITKEVIKAGDVELVHPWFMPGSPPVIVGLGRLSVEKDFKTLLRAFSLVKKKFHCRLLILGEGDERSSIEKLSQELEVSEDFLLPGFVDNPYKYLSRSSLFVLSSKYEGLPTALIEALAMGVPVVSTDCKSGPSEILFSGVHGRLVPVGDVEAMASAMLDVLSGGGGGVDYHVWDRFEEANSVKSYLDLIDGVL